MTTTTPQSQHFTKRYPVIQPRRWNRDEYHKMAECGIFGPEERWELIEGVIYETVGSMPRSYYAAIHQAREELQKAYFGNTPIGSLS